MGADGKVLGVFEEALAGGILAQAVGEAGHGVEPAPVDGKRAHAVEGRGLAIDGAGGRPGGAPGELVLADLVGGQRGGPRVAAEEGDEMGDPAAGGALGPELPDLIVLEVGVAELDRRTATALARSPALAVLLRGSGHAPADSENGRLDVPFVEETLDSSANRAMFALVLALIRRGLRLHDRLQELVDRASDSATRTSLGVRWPARKQVLAELVIRLKALRHQLPFAHVQRPEITAAGLTAVAADPSYARAWGRGWRALRRGLESGPSVERLWVSPSWEIYERWCFLRLGQLLSAARPEWHWSRRPDCWVGLSGTCRAELRLQPTFRSSPEETGRMWSISKERVPDLVLTVESAAGTRFLVLDAKYRSSRSNVLDAMASAHIYQDSLRIGPNRPDASLLLVPSGGGAPWLEAPTFQMMHQVGVHVLAPDRDNTIPEAITAVLVV